MFKIRSSHPALATYLPDVIEKISVSKMEEYLAARVHNKKQANKRQQQQKTETIPR